MFRDRKQIAINITFHAAYQVAGDGGAVALLRVDSDDGGVLVVFWAPGGDDVYVRCVTAKLVETVACSAASCRGGEGGRR